MDIKLFKEVGQCAQSNMDINAVKQLCIGLGQIQRFNKNSSCFGNIELEICTPNKTTIYITSDRGEFLCYVKRKKHFTHHLTPLNNILNVATKMTFFSLAEIISFLKSNILEIEKHI